MCSIIIFGDANKKYLAENYDYTLDHGLVAINVKGTHKSTPQQGNRDSLNWMVKYGSITFNQFSLELPVSGMNDVGLTVTLLWHEEGDFGNDSQAYYLNPLQWIQYQLDNFQNVSEVLEGLKKVRPERGPIPLHFAVLDAMGNSLLIEFIKGKTVLHKNTDYPIMTNNSYATCLVAAQKAFSEKALMKTDSIGRFNHLYQQALTLDKQPSSKTGFNLLDSVSQTPDTDKNFPWGSEQNTQTITAWSIVFDPVDQSIFLKTHKNTAIRQFDLKVINFEAESHYRVMDIHEGGAGFATNFFSPYTKEKNRQLLQLSAPALGIPEAVVNDLVDAVDNLYTHRYMSNNHP